jgi:hypothetical protein
MLPVNTKEETMLYESIFYWGNIVQAFLRDTTALFEEQTRQRQQYFEHWTEFWSKMLEPWLAAEDLTSIANTPWRGLIEVSEWTRQIAEQYAEIMVSGFGSPLRSQVAAIVEQLVHLGTQLQSAEYQLAMLMEHVQGMQSKGVEERLDVLIERVNEVTTTLARQAAGAAQRGGQRRRPPHTP